MEKLPTGITGLDQLIGGGIPKGFNVLVTGAPGAGKSILGLQYLYNGAMNGDPCLYVALDSSKTQLWEQSRQFGWDMEKLEQENKLHTIEIPLNREVRVNLFQLITDKVVEWKVKRIVFDSISSYMFNLNQFIFEFPTSNNLTRIPEVYKRYLGENPLYRQMVPERMLLERPDPRTYESSRPEQRMVYLAVRELSMLGTTNLIIVSAAYGGDKMTVDGVSEFVCDGVIMLDSVEIGNQYERVLRVVKMRLGKTVMDYRRFEITEAGIVVH